jgi:hypothetical protein
MQFQMTNELRKVTEWSLLNRSTKICWILCKKNLSLTIYMSVLFERFCDVCVTLLFSESSEEFEVSNGTWSEGDRSCKFKNVS